MDTDVCGESKGKHEKKGEPQTVTHAVTDIRLEATNAGKLTALDALAVVYLELTQQYTTLFISRNARGAAKTSGFMYRHA